MQTQPIPQHRLKPIDDAEWLFIHSDTFISDRERILRSQTAFKIDRDLGTVAAHLPNPTQNIFNSTAGPINQAGS